MATKKAPAKKTSKQKLDPKRAAMIETIQAVPFLTSEEKEMWAEALATRKLSELAPLPTLEKYSIEKYKVPQFVPSDADPALYDAKKNVWHSHEEGELAMHQILDTLAYATTRGKLNSRTWVHTVFHNEAAWDWFIEELAAYEQYFRIRDPWWLALAHLAEHEQEESGFSTAEEMADAIANHAAETGQAF